MSSRTKGLRLLAAAVVAASLLVFVSVTWAGNSTASCKTSTCQQIELIRQRSTANKYSFADPNYNVRIGQLLWALDYYSSYYDSVRQYYPTQQYFDAVVDGLRLNYLSALNVIVNSGRLIEDVRPANNGNGGGVGNANGPSKRIVLILRDGKGYSWKFTPPTKRDTAKIEYEGRRNR